MTKTQNWTKIKTENVQIKAHSKVLNTSDGEVNQWSFNTIVSEKDSLLKAF